jgi:DNA-binding SARP family transcriptional activator
MQFRILGPLDVLRRGRPVRLRGVTQRALLAALILHANEVVPADRLVDDLWSGHPPDTAPKMVQNAVVQLRKLLEPDRGRGAASEILLTRPPGYLLSVDPDSIDARRFERLWAEGQALLAAEDAVAAAEKLKEALALWRGPALADLADQPFAQAEADRLEEARLTATEDRLEAELAIGRAGDLVGELEVLVRTHPLRERLRAQLMLALYRSGRQADALNVYQRTRDLFVEELGLEPGPRLQRLERAVLMQEPELEVEPLPSSSSTAVVEPEEEPPREVRKTVSIVFAEFAPSVPRVDPEVLGHILPATVASASRVLERHGATVTSLAGGSLMAIFGLPAAHEDDALRAARAAVELREELPRTDAVEDVPLDLRIGIETGEVVAGTERQPPSPAGTAVTAASRLQQRAEVGEILLGPEAELLVRGAAQLEELAPRDGAHERAWRVLDVAREAPAVPRRLDAPMVGRAAELAQLVEAFDRVERERTSYLFTILGPAGIGKSRLANEFTQTIRSRARVLTGRCLPYGEGITFWPLAEVLRQASEEEDRAFHDLLGSEPDAAQVVNRVGGAIGVSEPAATAEETFWAARKLFEALAQERPLVLVFEDVHWAEPTFLDLVEHVADWTRGAPVLLLCLARPELLEDRPAWAGGKLNATSILLEPLSEHEADLLIENLEADPLAAEVRARITEAAEGNPLFLEQMLAMVGEHAAGGELTVPPTIHALLAARLDRLGRNERASLERAAVIGRTFWKGALEALAPELAAAAVDESLESLIRRDLIRPDRSLFPGEDAFRLRHILIGDTAYESIPKSERAELHERFADWLEQTAADREREYEEILGYHLERAYWYHEELGSVAAEQRALAARAAERLAAAGRRASARGDMTAAVRLLTRAAALLEEEAVERLEVMIDLADALRETGDLRRADEAFREAASAASQLADPVLEAHAEVVGLRLHLQRDPDLDPEHVRQAARRAVEIFEARGDERRLAKAWELLAWNPWFRCRAAEADRAVQRAIKHARRAGDARTEAQGLHLLIGASFFGPIRVDDAIGRCRVILEDPQTQQRVAASALRALAGLRAMQGDFEAARASAVRSRSILADLGLRVTAANAAETFGMIEMLAGDSVAAERAFRTGYEALAEMGATSTLATLAALLAQALYAEGRDEEALRLTRTSEQSAGREDFSTHVQWRAARAKVVARMGDLADGERLGREAAALAAQTDFLTLRGDTLIDLATVLLTAGRTAETVPVVEEALLLYEQKGNAVSAAGARALLVDLG